MSLVKIGLKIWIKNIPKKPKPNKKNKTKKEHPPLQKKTPHKKQKKTKQNPTLFKILRDHAHICKVLKTGCLRCGQKTRE